VASHGSVPTMGVTSSDQHQLHRRLIPGGSHDDRAQHVGHPSVVAHAYERRRFIRVRRAMVATCRRVAEGGSCPP